MSDPEHFIARWSRRKRQAAEDAEGTTSSSAPEPTDPPATLVDEGVHRDASPGRTIAAGGSEPAFDLTRLPSLEIDHGRIGSPGFPGPRCPVRTDPCGASPRLGRRSQNSRFQGARGLRLGLQHAGRHAGVWTVGHDRRTSARCQRHGGPQSQAGRGGADDAHSGSGAGPTTHD